MNFEETLPNPVKLPNLPSFSYSLKTQAKNLRSTLHSHLPLISSTTYQASSFSVSNISRLEVLLCISNSLSLIPDLLFNISCLGYYNPLKFSLLRARRVSIGTSTQCHGILERCRIAFYFCYFSLTAMNTIMTDVLFQGCRN